MHAQRAVDIAQQVIERTAPATSPLRAYRTFNPKWLHAQAEQLDTRFPADFKKHALFAMPVSVKDLFGVTGLPTFAGCDRPLPHAWEREGKVVSALKNAGALLTGKTHTVAFAYGGLGTNPHAGTPINRWSPAVERVCGGSSSGAPLSLLEGSARLAIATDTAGSVRIPASMNGLVGLKTTHGRWPTSGIVPLSPTFDTVGLLGRDVATVSTGFHAIEGGVQPAARSARSSTTNRIGIPTQLFWDNCSPGIAETVQQAIEAWAKQGGLALEHVSMPESVAAFEIFSTGGIASAELGSFLRVDLPDRLDRLDPTVRDRLRAGEKLTAIQYLSAIRRLDLLRKKANLLWTRCDVLVTPTVPITPPTLDELQDRATYHERNMLALRNTSVVSMLGWAAITVPVGLDAQGMPAGLQITGPAFSEELLLRLAASFENHVGDAAQLLGPLPNWPAPSAV